MAESDPLVIKIHQESSNVSQTKRAAQSVLMLIAFAVFSKVFGFIRQALIAARFGSGIETDIYFIAQSANALFTMIITSSLATTTIPVLTRVSALEGKKGKIDHASNMLSITFLIAVAISVLAWIIAPLIMKVFAYGFEEEQFEFAVFMMRIGSPIILFAALTGIFNGYLQSENRFFASSMGDTTQNVSYIIFLLFFASRFGIIGLMITTVLGVVAQLAVLVVESRAIGFRYRPILHFKDKYVQQVFTLIPPILLSVAINDVNSMIDKAMASTLVKGSISALDYASRLNILIVSIFVTSIVTVLYPLLAQGAAENNIQEVKKTTLQGINLIIIITIPATLGMLVFVKPIVQIAYERGAFDATATQMTAGALSFYTLSLVSLSIYSLITRVFYSLHDTKTPMINSAIAVVVNLTMNIILIRPLAHRGLALATSISSIVTTGILLLLLRKKIGVLGLNRTLLCGIKSTISAIIMTGVVLLVYSKTERLLGTSFSGKFSGLLIPIGVGAVLYFLLLYAFKVEELSWAVEMLKKRMKR